MNFIFSQTPISLMTTLLANLKRNRLKTLILSAFVLVSGCSTTATPASVSELNTQISVLERIDTKCKEQVQSQQRANTNPTLSQYLSLAHAAQHCVSDIQYSPQHPDVETAMQFTALAFVNYVNAGDMDSARNTLEMFRSSFPQQDLLFADYSSFVDTAYVLVNTHSLSHHQLLSLNINPTLRAEITRQRKWSID